MKITKKLVKVIADLEYEIGSECYNPNSYDGWNDIEGCNFRYPVNVPNEEGDFTKLRSNINDSFIFDSNKLTSQSVEYMKYKFGSNELMIGKGIVNILSYLEDRYDLNFSELEKNYQKK